MFNAYSVAVKIKLLDHVTGGLMAMSKQFGLVNGKAVALEAQLSKIKLLGAAGAGAAATGFMGLGLIGKALKPAEEYVHQLNIMNMAGLKQVDMANAIGDAWKTTGDVITTTATENLRTLLDLRNVLGNMDEARMAMPIVSRIQAVLASSSEGQIRGNSKELAYSMAKALDIIGAAQNKQAFEHQAEMMSKVIIATQGRVTPEAFKSVFQYARQAKYGLSDEFKYEILPSLIQENASSGGSGGGSRGVGPMLAALYRTTNQGYINKKSLPMLQSLGLVDANTAVKTTTAGTNVGHFKGWQLAASNSFEWVQQVLMPAIRHKYGENVSNQTIQDVINQAFRGNQLAAALALEYAMKPVNFYRDQKNIQGTMSTADAYKAAVSSDPNTARAALHAQWTNLETAFTMSIVPVLIPAMMKLTRTLNDIAQWARENPNTAKNIALGFTALFGALALGGTVTMAAAAFKGLGLALSVFAPGAGLAAALPTLAKGIGLLGAALKWGAGIGLAGAAGYAAGTFLYNHAIKGTSVEDSIGRAVASGMALFGNKDAQYALKKDEESRTMQTIAPRASSQPVQVHTQVNLDGRKVGEAVTQHQAREAGRPYSGTSGFDGSMNLSPVSR